MDIQFNSWQAEFKQPFGAIKNDSSTLLTIEVNESNEQVHQVSLLIKKGNESVTEYKMDRQNDNKYSYLLHISEGKGLYYYCFKVYAEHNNHSFPIYIGKNQCNGSNRQFYQYDEIQWYQLTCYEVEDNAPEWYQNAIFYQIFPDRFFNGNDNKLVNSPKKNSFLYGTENDQPMYIRNKDNSIKRWDFFGGNLMGIKKKIPYLKGLGITALYLNPIFEATSNHRYDTNDYFKIDPMLGSNEEFKELVEELHENNMKIILDGVFSHVGNNSRYFNYSKEYGENIGAYQNKESEFFNWFTFHEYPDKFESWWGITDLPEVNKLQPDYQEFIYGKKGVLQYWNAYDIDGWRIDVADEFPNFFLAGIRDRLDQFENQVLIGEVWEDASNKVAYGEEKIYASNRNIHGVMNYPFRDAILDLVNQKSTVHHTVNRLMNLKENYPTFFLNNTLNNIGTHDTKRLLTECHNSLQNTELAFKLMFVLPGVPCVYYGDEVGMIGEADPENRGFYPWRSGNQELKQMCQEIICLRKNSKALTKGDCYFLINKETDVLAIYRSYQNEKSLCLFNFSKNSKSISKNNWIGFDLTSEEIFKLIHIFELPARLNEKECIILFNEIDN